MDVVATKGKDNEDSNAEKKTKVDIGSSKVNSITTYFQRKISTEIKKGGLTKNDSSQIESRKDKSDKVTLSNCKGNVNIKDDGCHGDGNHGDSNQDNIILDDIKDDVGQSCHGDHEHGDMDCSTSGCLGDSIDSSDGAKGIDIGGQTSRKARKQTEPRKSKWNLTWKAKRKKLKKKSLDSDSDSDFEGVDKKISLKVDNNPGKPVQVQPEKPVSTNPKTHVLIDIEKPVSVDVEKHICVDVEKLVSVVSKKPVSKESEKPVSKESEKTVPVDVEKPVSIESEKPVLLEKPVYVKPGKPYDAEDDSKVILISENGNQESSEKSNTNKEAQEKNGKLDSKKESEKSKLKDKSRKSTGITNNEETRETEIQDITVLMGTQKGSKIATDSTASPVKNLPNDEGICDEDDIGLTEKLVDRSPKEITEFTQVCPTKITEMRRVSSKKITQFVQHEKLQKNGKSAFDVLMKSSREKASLKTETSDNEVRESQSSSGQEESKGKKRESKSVKSNVRNSKKCKKKQGDGLSLMESDNGEKDNEMRESQSSSVQEDSKGKVVDSKSVKSKRRNSQKYKEKQDKSLILVETNNENKDNEIRESQSSSGSKGKVVDSKSVKSKRRNSQKSEEKQDKSLSLVETDNEDKDLGNEAEMSEFKVSKVDQSLEKEQGTSNSGRKSRKRKALKGEEPERQSSRRCVRSDDDLDSPVKRLKRNRRQVRNLEDSDVEDETDSSFSGNRELIKSGSKNQSKRESSRLKKKLETAQLKIEPDEVKVDDSETALLGKAKQGGVEKKCDIEKKTLPKKATGPIAPIFLPGAWRRAKQKIAEDEQLQQSIIVVEEASEAMGVNAEANVVNIEDKTLDHIKPYSPIKDTGESLKAFMGLFKPAAVKCSSVVVEFIEAPFPKVSHVRQVTNDLKEKWNLPMVTNRYIKKEFFISTDVRVNCPMEPNCPSLCGFLNIWLSDSTVNWKDFQVSPIPKMNGHQTQPLIRFLKTIYCKVPLKKLFKRCHIQLQRCKKAELESLNSERHSTISRLFQSQTMSNPCTDHNKMFSVPSGTVSRDTEKSKPFTKISKKDTTSSKKGMKGTKTSPLLMAFKKQSEAPPPPTNENAILKNSKKNEKKKQPTRKKSVRDYLDVPAKNDEAIPGNAIPNKASKKELPGNSGTVHRGRKSKDIGDFFGNTVTVGKKFRKNGKKSGKDALENETGSPVVESGKKSKKRSTFPKKVCRKSPRGKREPSVEIVEKENRTKNGKKRERDVIEIDKSSGPATKKVKLLTDVFKQPKKGRKRKDNTRKTTDSNEVVTENSYTNSESNPVIITSMSPKISSDEDFVKTSKRSKTTTKTGKKVAIEEDHGGSTEGTRKSSRLRKKAEEIDGKELSGEKMEESGKISVEEVGEDRINETKRKNGKEVKSRTKDSDKSDVTNEIPNNNDTQGKNATQMKNETETKNETVVKNDTERKNETEGKNGTKGENGTEVKSEIEVKIVAELEPAISCVSDVRTDSLATVAQTESSSQPQARSTTGQRPSVLWTECFKPGRSDEILGNISGGNKLKNWLKEWRNLREKRLNKIRRHQEKKRVRMTETKGSSEWWYDEEDEDSDFDMSDDSDDSYCDEEDALCDTMLLTGPTGCGKTSAVYACAKELGFKVIEVNSSTKRGGKYILSEFQEATQSHQVSRKRHEKEQEISASLTSGDHGDSKCEKTSSGRKGSKKNRTKKKEIGKNKKEEEPSQSVEMVQVKMSLILLDEVDVLFEDDKGFWAAVNSLKLHSKRPIVMTASDYVTCIDGIFEHISLKSPSPLLHASYLQTICLSKNVFANPNDIQTLANVHNGDLRQSLHTLQFWIDSYAGACDPGGCDRKIDTDDVKATEQTGRLEVDSVDKKIDVKSPSAVVVELDVSKEIDASLSENICHISEPTICLSNQTSEISHTDMEDTTSEPLGQDLSHASQKKKKSMPPPAIETYTPFLTPGSNLEGQLDHVASKSSNLVDNKVGTSEDKCESLGNDRCNNESKTEIVKVNDVPHSGKIDYVLHEFCMESFLGLRNVASNIGGALEVVSCGATSNRPSKYSFAYKCSVTSHCQSLGIDVVRCNLATLLPCLFACFHGNEDTNTAPQGHTIKDGDEKDVTTDEDGVSMDTSLFDDDAGDSNVTVEVLDKDLEPCEPKEPEVKDQTQEGIHKKILNAISLEVYCECLENMSFLDSELRCNSEKQEQRFGNWFARVRPGLEDTVDTSPFQFSWKSRTALDEIRGAFEMASLECSNRRFHDRVGKTRQKSKAFSVLSSDNSLYSQLCDECKARHVSSNIKDQDEPDRVGLGSRIDDLKTSSRMTSDVTALHGINPSPTIKIMASNELSTIQKKRAQDFGVLTMCFQDHIQLNRSALALDYIPTLRNICHNELLRQASRTKRRFYHYFDSVGLNVPHSTTQLLNDDAFAW